MANKTFSLTLEEQDLIAEWATSPSYKVLQKILVAIEESQKDRVVRYNLKDGDDRHLAFEKARLEGTIQAFTEMKNQVDKVKKAYLNKK